MLRSDVTCKTCSHTSTVHDPTVGLSLDVPLPLGGPGGGGHRRGGGSGGGPGVTLEACLRQFARPEQLSDSESFPCARCGDVQHVKTKQLSVRRLPPVLMLHLKRFEHVQKGSAGWGGSGRSGGGGSGGLGSDGVTVGRKIEAHVAFSFVLSMRPYCASSTLRSRYGNRVSPAAEVASDENSQYDLFAVIVHTGSMESGHYTAYVQWQGAWFRCDDHQVTRADPITVAAAQAYLLFYSARTAGSGGV